MKRGALAILAVLGFALPAGAELEWLPEGQFYARVAAPIQGTPITRGSDTNFDIVAARFGTRLAIAPGLSARAVGELFGDPSRRSGDLRLGYAEYSWEPLGIFRAGQVPLLGDASDEAVGHLVIGSSVFSRSFLSPGGLGASWDGQFDAGVATAGVTVAATYTEGLLGSVGLPYNASSSVTGPGPALHGRVSARFMPGVTAHVYGRYGQVVDQQVATILTGKLLDVDLLLGAGASVSAPVVLDPTRNQRVALTPAADGALTAQARYNLGAAVPAWWRSDLVLRGDLLSRNFTNTATESPDIPQAVPRTDLLTTLALIYRVTDYTTVAVDLADSRDLGTGTSALLFGVRGGVGF